MIPHSRMHNDRFSCRVSSKPNNQPDWLSWKHANAAIAKKTLPCAVDEDITNSCPRKSDFPELVERRRHRTSVCQKKKKKTWKARRIHLEINHILLYSSGEADIEQNKCTLHEQA